MYLESQADAVVRSAGPASGGDLFRYDLHLADSTPTRARPGHAGPYDVDGDDGAVGSGLILYGRADLFP